MKKLLLASLMILFSIGSCDAMEQSFGGGKEEVEEQEESKVPMLKELAAQIIAQKGLEKIDSYNAPEEVKELIRQESLPYIMDLIDPIQDVPIESVPIESERSWFDIIKEVFGFTKPAQPQPTQSVQQPVPPVQRHVDPKLIEKIPSLLFNAMLNDQIDFSKFIKRVTKLPEEIRQLIAIVFANQIKNYTQANSITLLKLNPNNDAGKRPSQLKDKKGRPISFLKLPFQPRYRFPFEIYNARENNAAIENKIFFIPIIQIMASFRAPENRLDELIPIFIGQQLQLMIINTLKDKFKQESPLFSQEERQKILNVKNQLNEYQQTKDEKQKKSDYISLYIEELSSQIKNLLCCVTSVTSTKFIWDENTKVYIAEQDS